MQFHALKPKRTNCSPKNEQEVNRRSLEIEVKENKKNLIHLMR